MTSIKMCGLSRPCDIYAVNQIMPEYIGFVFAEKSRRFITRENALALKNILSPDIKTVGVFVNENMKTIADFLQDNIIDYAQLHGNETNQDIYRLRQMTDKPIIQAFQIHSASDAEKAVNSTADMILLDAGAGGGTVFDWALIKEVKSPYFLAGGLNGGNIADAVRILHPYAVDVSSGIETNGFKDIQKMTAFAAAVRKENV